ncbi:hypothetical protein BDF19DRAFT_447201 [Syncephalis fuscata]|nr:hypothetical protein BDF19DRAFT_447201 [Syncephalis fuscata]
MEFTIPHEKLKAALNCFINTAVKSFDLDQYQTTQIIARSIAAHIEKIGLTDTLNYSLNKLLNKLLGVQAIKHQKLLCGLQCTFQLYKHPSILLPYVDCRVHADIREMSLRVVKNILNGMTEQHAKAITVGTWQNIEQALTIALSDDETAVILASMDIVKTYTVLHYQLHGHTWSLHHEPSVRRLALSTTISIWHNESLTADQNSILTVITTNDIELLIGDDEWETRLMTCHLLEQLWQAASNTTPSIHQLLFYRWTADQWLLQAVSN